MVIYRDGSSSAAVVQAFAVCRLFSDAKSGKNAVQNVVGRGCAGDSVDGPERSVEIHQEHFVRNAELDRAARVLESFERFFKQILVPQAGDAAAFWCGEALGSQAA